jgi:hypothetical protein
MRADSDQAAAVRERLDFARGALRDAQATLALIRQARTDLMRQGARATNAEQRAYYVIEEQLARRRVGEWTDRLTAVEANARYLGIL